MKKYLRSGHIVYDINAGDYAIVLKAKEAFTKVNLESSKIEKQIKKEIKKSGKFTVYPCQMEEIPPADRVVGIKYRKPNVDGHGSYKQVYAFVDRDNLRRVDIDEETGKLERLITWLERHRKTKLS